MPSAEKHLFGIVTLQEQNFPEPNESPKWHRDKMQLCCLTSQPFAMAKPPPSSRIMFQGTVSWAFLHVSKGCISVFGARRRENPTSSTHPKRSTSVTI